MICILISDYMYFRMVYIPGSERPTDRFIEQKNFNALQFCLCIDCFHHSLSQIKWKPIQRKANKQTLCWLQPCNHLLSFYSSVHLSVSINFANVFNLMDFCTYIVVRKRMCVCILRNITTTMCVQWLKNSMPCHSNSYSYSMQIHEKLFICNDLQKLNIEMSKNKSSNLETRNNSKFWPAQSESIMHKKYEIS